MTKFVEKVPSHSGWQNMLLITFMDAFQRSDSYFCWKFPCIWSGLPWPPKLTKPACVM